MCVASAHTEILIASATYPLNYKAHNFNSENTCIRTNKERHLPSKIIINASQKLLKHLSRLESFKNLV